MLSDPSFGAIEDSLLEATEIGRSFPQSGSFPQSELKTHSVSNPDPISRC
jgi:hypothetical protein